MPTFRDYEVVLDDGTRMLRSQQLSDRRFRNILITSAAVVGGAAALSNAMSGSVAGMQRSSIKVTVQQIILEDDPDNLWNSNDVQRSWYKPAGTPLYFSEPGIKRVTPVPVYPLTATSDDNNGAEEVFHRVKFWVTSNGVTVGPKL